MGEELVEHAGELLSIPGVVGVAEGESGGEPCVVVLVEIATEELGRALPTDLGGHPVEIRETGTFEAL